VAARTRSPYELRGFELPATAGIGVLVGLLAGIALSAILNMLFPDSRCWRSERSGD